MIRFLFAIEIRKAVRFILLLLTVFVCSLRATSQTIDIQHYQYTIELNDANDTITATAKVQAKFLHAANEFSLDLVQPNSSGKGMKVQSVTSDRAVAFAQQDNQLFISLPEGVKEGGLLTVTISYSGVPADGLIISKNKWGDRTFFADNWPDRAHHWIPCNDRPDDKASFEFIVTAPQHYKVISNGVLVEEKNLTGNKRLTHWKEDIALPTKIMVIGAARFAVKTFGDSPTGLPVSAWVYPQDSIKGFYDYNAATDIVKFFSAYIGPFPYKKLANVQSKTRFGGMENAGAIFYNENYITGDRYNTHTIAHEIVHQWFGDMASEKSFAHLWLSEGFATYLTDMYLEYKWGKDSANSNLKDERKKVIQFVKSNTHPVVDSSKNLMSLLNANSYEKGGWVLHMLRQQTGNSVFKKIIQTYYKQYSGGNADTKDFEAVAEQVWAKNLKPFFDQWLYRPGIPVLSAKWEYKKDSLTVTIRQVQKTPFIFPLEIGFRSVNGKKDIRKAEIRKSEETFTFAVKEKPVGMILDPDTKLLFEDLTPGPSPAELREGR